MKLKTYIFCFAALLLASCEAIGDWFYQPVDYQGNSLDPKMVVSGHLQAGEHPAIFVNTAYFIRDSLRMNIDTMAYSSYPTQDGYEEEYSIYRAIRKGYLHNADVRMRVNGGEWLRLTEKYALLIDEGRSYNESIVRYPAWFFTCDYVFQPGDNIELTVHDESLHADASVEQRIPDRLDFTISNIDTVPMPAYKEDGMFVFDLNLPACAHGRDMMRIRATCYVSSRYKSVWRDYDAETHTFSDWHDTVYVSREIYQPTFGQNNCFAAYDNLCSTLSQGWYGSQIGLYADAPSQPTTIHMAAYYKPYVLFDLFYYGEREGYDSYSRRQTDSVEIEVSTLTREAYLYTASMVNADYYSRKYDYWVPDPWTTGEMGDDIIGSIQDIFDEMGSLEPVPIFGNVHGALGHVTAGCAARVVYIP